MTWLYVPALTSSPSAQASADSKSASASLSQPRDAFVMWKGKSMRHRALCAAWKRAPFIRLLSGLTSELSTLDRGVALWIASLRVSRANPSATPASEQESMTPATFGPKWSAWLASAGRLLYFSKTCRDLSLFTAANTCERSSRTWSDWVTKWRRACLQRRKWVRRIAGSGCSSWPTANASEHKRTGKYTDKQMNRPEGKPRILAYDAEQWPTPHVLSGTDATGKVGADGEFAKAVEQWATPNTARRGTEDASKKDKRRSESGGGCSDLLTQAEYWDSSPRGQAISAAGPKSCASPPDSRPRLSPAFVEWLMNLPIGHTACGPAVTEWCRYVRLSRGQLSRLFSA